MTAQLSLLRFCHISLKSHLEAGTARRVAGGGSQVSIEGEMLSVSCTKLSLRKKRGRNRMRRWMVHRRMPLPKATRANLSKQILFESSHLGDAPAFSPKAG